ncbi:MAG: hypothetical protein IJN55_08075 [Alistipes sp.]|nr:hypothetical protein [Alistipes sp.]
MAEIVKQSNRGFVEPTISETVELKVRTKADAIVYAIEMTKFSKAPYKQAKKLFNFICKNVELPDTDVFTLEQVHKVAAGIVDMVYEKAREGKNRKRK